MAPIDGCFTPGPWKAERGSVYAEISEPCGTRHIVHRCTGPYYPEKGWARAVANACLIACAPDMLAVCESVAAHGFQADGVCRLCGQDQSRGHHRNCLVLDAEATINKAGLLEP